MLVRVAPRPTFDLRACGGGWRFDKDRDLRLGVAMLPSVAELSNPTRARRQDDELGPIARWPGVGSPLGLAALREAGRAE